MNDRVLVMDASNFKEVFRNDMVLDALIDMGLYESRRLDFSKAYNSMYLVVA